MASRIEFTKDSLTPSFDKVMPVLHSNLYQIMRFHEPRIRAEAKTKAPWTDRTSNARNGLDAKAYVPNKHVYALVLFHRVPYGIWLEIRFAGRDAIIMPMIRSYYPVVLASMAKLLDRMKIGRR